MRSRKSERLTQPGPEFGIGIDRAGRRIDQRSLPDAGLRNDPHGTQASIGFIRDGHFPIMSTLPHDCNLRLARNDRPCTMFIRIIYAKRSKGMTHATASDSPAVPGMVGKPQPPAGRAKTLPIPPTRPKQRTLPEAPAVAVSSPRRVESSSELTDAPPTENLPCPPPRLLPANRIQVRLPRPGRSSSTSRGARQRPAEPFSHHPRRIWLPRQHRPR